jgi:tripartite-type tricarboxylate transporter receptor subunit TctC
VAMAARSPLLPDVPKVGEAGLAGMEAAVLIGISTTGGTPAALVERLNAVVNEALGDEGVRQKLQELGFIPIGGTAAFYARSLAEETAKWRKVIKESKIPAPA